MVKTLPSNEGRGFQSLLQGIKIPHILWCRITNGVGKLEYLCAKNSQTSNKTDHTCTIGKDELKCWIIDLNTQTNKSKGSVVMMFMAGGGWSGNSVGLNIEKSGLCFRNLINCVPLGN